MNNLKPKTQYSTCNNTNIKYKSEMKAKNCTGTPIKTQNEIRISGKVRI